MTNYFVAILLLTPFAAFFRDGIMLVAVFAVCSFFLFVLPSTGYDYDYYKQAFDNAYVTLSYPWFSTDSIITAEPFYIWYTAAVSVLTPLPFQGFLVLNFIFCGVLSFFAFRKLKVISLDLFWISFLPVVVPTLFYFSPRSSISLFWVLLGFMLLVRRKVLFALPCLFLGISIHSQYILITTFTVVAYLVYAYSYKFNDSIRKKLGLALIFMAGLSLLGVQQLMGVLSSALGVLPSAEVAVSKLHYLESARSGYRLTAILSIIVYPAMMYLIFVRKKKLCFSFFDNRELDETFVHMLALVIIFGAMINIVFIGESHLAGRLSRFSDYIGMGVVLPTFFVIYLGRVATVFILWALVWLAPLMYSTVYGVGVS